MRFENGNVYNNDGMFILSEYECGIKSCMSKSNKIKLVKEREDSLYSQNEEQELKNQGII